MTSSLTSNGDLTLGSTSPAERRLLGAGRLQAALTLVVGLATAVLTVATTTRFPASAAQLAGAGFVVLAVSVLLGWSAGVGLAGVPLLSGAVIEIATVSTQDWLRATAIGCLWYCTSELAWDSIERRDGHRRTTTVTRRRLQEVATVVALTLILALVALALVDQAPDRTLLVQVLVLVLAVAGVVAAGRHLEAVAPDDTPK